jgi:lysozyme family protein
MTDFRRALDIVLTSEGGYVHDPDDHGGATNLGVTQRTYDDFRARHQALLQSVEFITYDEAAAIYWQGYWSAAYCDRMPWPLSLIHFDAAVNCGPHEAAKLLQRALGVAVDGIIGPLTLNRVVPAGPRDCLRYLLERAFHYRAIAHGDPTQQKFLAGGWLLRLERLYEEVG